MEPAIILLLFAVLFILPAVALARARQAQREIEHVKVRLRALEDRELTPPVPESVAAESKTSSPVAASVHPALAAEIAQPVAAHAEPPPLPAFGTPRPPQPKIPSPSRPPRPPINWEQFMGAKMFAWVGGLALFLGVAFFVKYSFEHNLIPPEMRVAIGFAVGLALIIGGLALRRKENVVTAQTLCATGILILYAVTFACRAFYHFSFFGLVPTFACMTLITAAAFLLAVRMNAIAVAILGIAGGFLTPILLSTGQDNPVGLFGYIALLDIGLLLLARRKEWSALPILGAIGTALTQVMWVGAFFERNQYFAGNHTLIAMTIFLAFQVLFAVVAGTNRREGNFDRALSGAALAIAAFALGWAFYFLAFDSIAHRPALLFSYLFLVDAALLMLIAAKEKLGRLLTMAGSAVFLFLMLWTTNYLTTRNLYLALAAYLIFALGHSVAPLLLARRGRKVPLWPVHLFPAITLGLILIPICQLASGSLLVWPFVFCVDVLALLAAVATGMLGAFLLGLVLTLVALGAWLLKIPSAQLTGLDSSLLLIGGFAVFFIVAAMWASRRLHSSVASRPGKLFGAIGQPANAAVQIPTLAASLPFLLLIMTVLRLPLFNPTPVFVLALVLIILLLGLTKLLSIDVLAVIALVSVLLLEYVWHLGHFQSTHARIALAWYLGFTALLTAFPFLFQRQFASRTLVWATSALAAPLHFFLIYDLMKATYPNEMPGLLPAAFVLPMLLCFTLIQKRTLRADSARISQLALFGGAALFFITLIFPIQLDREWLTLGWALEGAALCWFFQRVPHPGLRLTGVTLIAVAFARLALNLTVLSYHSRASAPILNWYLYAYGIVAVCAFAAARLFKAPRHLILSVNVPPLLNGLGTILLFLLLNIEIADYFSTPGSETLTFQFSGNFARDMSYSIAWALFALILLIIGIYNRSAGIRYAGLALLAIVILKLFLHDLSQLDQLYRIAAFIVVAAIAIIASFLYQRFLGSAETQSTS